jgi:hypothetical protein
LNPRLINKYYSGGVIGCVELDGGIS